MKHTASAKKSSSARGTSTRRRKSAASARRFAVCVRNDGYEASLERNKIYTVLPDDEDLDHSDQACDGDGGAPSTSKKRSSTKHHHQSSPGS